jgi:PAS domain S-box-containing protein
MNVLLSAHPAAFGLSREDRDRDAARIQAELINADVGTDPFVAAVRATRMPMIITDPRLPDNPIVFANESFCRLTGYARGEILGRNCRFLQGPETDRAAVARIRNAVAAATSIEIDIRNHRKDGTAFWNRLLMAPVRDADGNLAYFFASQVDVTIEREQLEGLQTHNAALLAELAGRLHAQQESEARLRFAARAGRMGLWELDLQSNELTTSPVFRENFGREPELAFGLPDLLQAAHPDERAMLSGSIAASAATGADFDIEFPIIRPDHANSWVQMRAQVVCGPDGGAVRIAGISLDNTARKRVEEELQSLNATLEARVLERTAERDRAWNKTQDLLCVVGRDGIFRTVNSAWTTVLGWQPEQIAGRHYLDFVHTDDRDGSVMAHARALQGQLPTYECRLLHKEGGFRWIAWVAAPEGDMVYASGRHVTAEKEAASALARAEELLRQSQKMEAVGHLTGGIAHDFNNLLGSISGSLELLQRRVDAGRTENLERYTSAAITAAQRAASLTQRLLAFARRQPLDPKRVEVNRLVADMEDLLRRTLGPAVDMEMILAGGLWSTLCDPNQLESAILNLAINARDAMPQGGRLTIETSNAYLDDAYARSQGGEVKPGQYVAVSVTDTGTGMSPDIIAKVFDPFFTTKPIGQGTGLGLSMLYGFVKQSDGHVRIYSEVGNGTTFRLYLPRKRGRAAEDTPDEANRGKALALAEPGETILVVDDEASLRMLVIETLQELGYGAIEACDGPSALQILQSDARVDLLVTDVGLPGLNGRQVADAARVLRPNLLVLFITGYAHNAAIGSGAALDPGMEIISKPFALDALAGKVRDMIERL